MNRFQIIDLIGYETEARHLVPEMSVEESEPLHGTLFVSKSLAFLLVGSF